MLLKNIFTKFKEYQRVWNGSTISHDLSGLSGLLNEVNRYHEEFAGKNDSELKDLSRALKNRALSGEDEKALLQEAFALAKEAARRVLLLEAYDEQLLAGMALHFGMLAEMQTGEGKTLAAVFPAYLNAISGKGVHILTFNDYLARRDANWMGPVFSYLGLTTGYVCQGMSAELRRTAYNEDITYVTAKESGFDFLRDNLCYQTELKVQRPFQYAIIDEADSILIDEARIPLVIAGAGEQGELTETGKIARVAKSMQSGQHFTFDEYARNIILTGDGAAMIEQAMGIENVYDPDNSYMLAQFYCALHAEHLLTLNVDYIIRGGKVILVDEFTGRVAEKRRWPDGIQEALEVKENLAVQAKGKILNSITLQHLLKLYPRLSGMTATAQISESEFREFYNLHIIVIPTHRPCNRTDHPDRIFTTRKAKDEALLQEIVSVHATGRPILVGTASVRESLELSELLGARGVHTKVLNAKNDEAEASIIAEAGRPGTVTISTNMAGRGTDIKLGGIDEKERGQVLRSGGLYVIGTNKHESRRIDRQLCGRAGRQGDPGSSRFFVSLEDDLCVKYKLADLLPAGVDLSSMEECTDPAVITEVKRLQRIVEGQNLEIKKTLLNYTSLIELQRVVMNEYRNELLSSAQLCTELFMTSAPEKYEQLSLAAGETEVREMCQLISLLALDKVWAEYLSEIADLREGIHLNRLGGRNPQYVFRRTAVNMFDEFFPVYESDAVAAFEKLETVFGHITIENTGLKVPTATWTYLVNDNPFEDMLGIQMLSNVNFSVNAILLGPFLALYAWLKKRQRG